MSPIKKPLLKLCVIMPLECWGLLIKTGRVMKENILKKTLNEVTQPFIDLFKSSRALWGINIAYFLEGFLYFGMLTLLAMYFNDYVGLNDVKAGFMVSILTA